MLATLRDISVKVASGDDVMAVDQPDAKFNLPPVKESDLTPSTPAEVPSEEVADAPSESGSEAPSVDTPITRSLLRQEGSASEYGETDDEGMVIVGRHH
jgi:lysophosphatidate acyltransferase